MRATTCRRGMAAVLLAAAWPLCARGADGAGPLVITRSTKLSGEAALRRGISVEADDVVVDGGGVMLRGPGRKGDLGSFQGIGIRIRGRSRVVIRNVKAAGFECGLVAEDCSGLRIEDCDFSDNYHDPDHGWGDGKRNGGMILTRANRSVITRTRANRVWNGLDLRECRDNRIEDCDLSHCSNVCLKMWNACRNRVSDCNLSWGLRMKPGEVHARDSTCVLLESGSNGNRFERNDITHGGDGVFIRPLNGWVSTANVFVENDCSWANNNGFESWAPGNTFLRNRANHCSYGFWLGGSDNSIVAGNEASHNGLASGKHNAPESDFRHGGIVIVGGQGNNCVLDGNRCADNNGGGIVFRGDLGTRGGAWRMENIIVQNNVLEDNDWGVYARFTEGLFLGGNSYRRNRKRDEFLDDVTAVRRGTPDPQGRDAPSAVLEGPSRVAAGERVVFDASGSRDALSRPLSFVWRIGGEEITGARVDRIFEKPGFRRVQLLVTNGHLAASASRDLYVFLPVKEPATEGGAALWDGGKGAPGRGAVSFHDASEAMVGTRSVRMHVEPPGGTIEAGLSLDAVAPGILRPAMRLGFWLRFRTGNNGGFGGPSPMVRLHAGKGAWTYLPARGGRPVGLLRSPPYAEARYGWLYFEIPLSGSKDWIRLETFEGKAPPYVNAGLKFETVETPMATQGDSALVSTGRYLFCLTREGDRLWRSEDGRQWEPRAGPRRSLGSAGGMWENGMLAAWKAPGGTSFLVGRQPGRERDAEGRQVPRYVLYDVERDTWRWTPTYATAGHAAVVAGNRLYGIAHAVGGNYGGPLARVDLAHLPGFDDRTVPGGLHGSKDRWWFSRAAKLAVAGGRIYGIKNDWATPRPENPAAGSDRLFVFDPADYRPSAFTGSEPFSESSWKAAETPVDDLGSLPFEVGHGSALVPLCPRFSQAVGARGGLFVLAGCSPSDHEGHGTPSDRFALYDIASSTFVVGALPAETGGGSSAIFHRGKVFIKRGGLSYDVPNRQLWIVTPLAPGEKEAAEREAARRRLRLEEVDRLGIQVACGGPESFDLWIDGLGFLEGGGVRETRARQEPREADVER